MRYGYMGLVTLLSFGMALMACCVCARDITVRRLGWKCAGEVLCIFRRESFYVHVKKELPLIDDLLLDPGSPYCTNRVLTEIARSGPGLHGPWLVVVLCKGPFVLD